ncbi:MAG: helix-turn-helix domain-containing protein [Clostridia bacterium]|nr:helix-turn-helix domain-containing protein [Clostridia bacterium]
MQFKDILRDLRENRGLTQKNIADSCALSPTCICQLETGARNPTGSTLSALADFFGVSTDYLLGRSDDFGVISIKNQSAEFLPGGKELLDIYNGIEPEYRAQILEYARYFAERRGLKIRKN